MPNLLPSKSVAGNEARQDIVTTNHSTRANNEELHAIVSHLQ
jgi:hypothetical protein